MKFTQELGLILPAAFIVNHSPNKMEMRMPSTLDVTSMGISASMANAVTPEVANELTFRFTSAYLRRNYRLQLPRGPVKEAMHSSSSRKNRKPGAIHTMDT